MNALWIYSMGETIGTVSKEISQLKEAAARQSKIDAMRIVGDKIAEFDKQVAEVEIELNALTSSLPNIPDARVPYGKDDSENVVINTVREQLERAHV